MIGSSVLISSACYRYGAIDFREGGTGGRLAKRSAMTRIPINEVAFFPKISISNFVVDFVIVYHDNCFVLLFVVHADAPSSEEEPAKENSDVEKADAEIVIEKADSEEVEKVAAEEVEEEEEPEDVRVLNDPSYYDHS